MTLLRVFILTDNRNRITIPKGVCKKLEIKPGDKLELTIKRINKINKVVIAKHIAR